MASSSSTSSSYFSSLPNSFTEKVIEDFAGDPATSNAFLASYTEKFPTLSNTVKGIYENGLQGSDTLDGMFPEGQTGADTFIPPPASTESPAWTFITAPENVSWDVANQANRIDIYGTNNPPVVAGSRGMRDLTLSDALVEGYVRNVTVEAKIAALENLMNYGLNGSDGFVSVPVYQVWANSKSYGGPEAYYIIKDIRIKESMRDLQGNATRATVDISLMQVPAYQVNSGRDQASQTTAGAESVLAKQAKDAAATGTSGATAAAATDTKVATANPGANTKAGPNSAKPSTPPKPPARTPVRPTEAIPLRAEPLW